MVPPAVRAVECGVVRFHARFTLFHQQGLPGGAGWMRVPPCRVPLGFHQFLQGKVPSRFRSGAGSTRFCKGCGMVGAALRFKRFLFGRIRQAFHKAPQGLMGGTLSKMVFSTLSLFCHLLACSVNAARNVGFVAIKSRWCGTHCAAE